MEPGEGKGPGDFSGSGGRVPVLPKVEHFFFLLFGAVAPLSIAALNACLGVLCLFYLGRLARFKVKMTPPQWALAAFLAWNLVSALLSPSRGVALKGVLDYWCWVPFFVALALPRDVAKEAGKFSAFLAASASLTLIRDVGSFFFGMNFQANSVPTRAPVGTIHATGFFGHHLTYAGLVCLCLFFLAARALYGGGRRWPWFGACAACAAGLVMSLARTYFLAALPAAVYLIWNKGRRWILAGSLAAALALTLLLSFGPARLRQRVESFWDPSNASNVERVYLWVSGWQMFLDRPVTGWGPSVYTQYAEPYRAPYAKYVHYPDREGFRPATHCHNLYLVLAIHSGAVGLALFLLFVALAFRDLRRQEDPALRFGVAAAWIALLVGGLFEFNAGDAEVATLAFFLLGLGLNRE